MSFQKIFEMAKRHGMPLIVTDKEGREPVVVLPLDMYEAMSEGGKSVAPSLERIIKPVDLGEGEPDLSSLSLEERFYIESPDEAENR